MSSKFFDTELECGCLLAHDTGTKEKPDGNSGLIPCGYSVSNEVCVVAWDNHLLTCNHWQCKKQKVRR